MAAAHVCGGRGTQCFMTVSMDHFKSMFTRCALGVTGTMTIRRKWNRSMGRSRYSITTRYATATEIENHPEMKYTQPAGYAIEGMEFQTFLASNIYIITRLSSRVSVLLCV